ncbi:hypothetical protein [Eubacterium sp.]|uniref:hypothetical protein n=1 Tax=Eubacterium sp. TaxID=142586 RepID=UPI002FC6524A
MSRINYNKLVRDRIPEIIEASGKQAKWDIREEEYRRMVDAKLADLLENLCSTARARGGIEKGIRLLEKDELVTFLGETPLFKEFEAHLPVQPSRSFALRDYQQEANDSLKAMPGPPLGLDH